MIKTSVGIAQAVDHAIDPGPIRRARRRATSRIQGAIPAGHVVGNEDGHPIGGFRFGDGVADVFLDLVWRAEREPQRLRHVNHALDLPRVAGALPCERSRAI